MNNKIAIVALMILGTILIVNCKNQDTTTLVKNDKEALSSTDSQPPTDYLKAGRDLALETKSNLGKNLVLATAQRGSDGAVEFCNIQAIPITDSMSLVLGAKIKRVSDQPRNPINQANEAELAYIKAWKDSKASGEEHAPIVTEIDGKMVGYYPITSNKMCLQCHGKIDKDINIATQKKIKMLYPADRATGYTEDEIRGIFVVEMDKK